MNKRSQSKRKPAAETASTIGDAAQILGVLPAWVKASSRAIGIRAAGGRIMVPVVRKWISEHRAELENPKLSTADQKLFEQVRRLRHQNDKEEAGLVELAWVRERFLRFMNEAHDIKNRALESHPHRFLAAGSDVAACRVITKQIWDENMRALQACSRHFEE